MNAKFGAAIKAISLFMSVFAAYFCRPVAAVAGDRPNVVLILSDDHGYPHYGFMGHPIVETPRLDRLAGQGLLYTRGYVTTSLCCPSLATILTGRYPHQHGFTGNDPVVQCERPAWLKKFFTQPQFPAIMQAAGYRTLQTGKYWFGDPKKSGFTDQMGDTGRHGGEGLAIGRETMRPIEDFIAGAVKDNAPFFVWYAPMMPHLPHNPPARLLDKYPKKTTNAVEAKYYAMVEWFDETCGKLLDCLDKHGVSANTLVVYLADNGWNPDDVGSLGNGDSKLSPWEMGVRQPIVIRWPVRVKPRRDETHLASNVDLAQTILKACGLRPPPEMEGVDLLDDKAVAARKAIYLEQYCHNMVDVNAPEKSLQSLGIVSGEWKLLLSFQRQLKANFRPGKDIPEDAMLFNVLADPMEKHNVVAANKPIVDRLAAMIDEWWNPRRPAN